MGCIIELNNSGFPFQIEFNCEGAKQKMLIDVLIKYSDMNSARLALTLGVSEDKLKNICDGNGFLVGKEEDSLAQLFMRFFGQHFFGKFTLIRNFIN